MARVQTIVQLTDELIDLLDERAARDGVSRSSAVRAAVEAYLDVDRQRQIDERIVAGYRRHAHPGEDDTGRFAEGARRAAWEDLDW